MKLVVISNMAHYKRDGAIVGHGATSRELSAVADLFDTVRHVACLHGEPAPASALPYTASNIELVPVPPAGGETIASKLDIVRLTPLYVRTIIRELQGADVVHVRCPANISLYAIALLSTRREPSRRWIKYAGNWRPTGPEPRSYMLQRKWLERGLARAEITINGTWSGQPPHVHTFTNPCLTDSEIARGRMIGEDKRLRSPIRLLFVGHLGAAKNPQAVVDALALLPDAVLDVVGEGDASELARLVAASRLDDRVTIHGPLPRPSLDMLYGAAHFVVLPSRTEGWPKVLSEGMAYGALPIATAVGSIPDTLSAIRAGAIMDAATGASIAQIVRRYADNPAMWSEESARAIVAAPSFSYSTFRGEIGRLLALTEQ